VDEGPPASVPADHLMPRFRDSSQPTPSQRYIHLAFVKYCKDTGPGSSSKQLKDNTACFVGTLHMLQLQSASTISF